MGAQHASSARVHAIILTRDRPETLRRCLRETLCGLGPQDRVTILDDSSATGRVRMLDSELRPREHPAALFHVRSHEVEMVVSGSVGARPLWLSRMASRDIAPLRNLSLLLSAVIAAETTLLIDDDVCKIDPVGMHRCLDMAEPARDVIAGVAMTGISELDTITRLTDAIEELSRLDSDTDDVSPRSLFQAPPKSLTSNRSECRYVSGGYLAFRLACCRLFAFPPGYNEDWLWCLLQSNSGVRVTRTLEAVAHEPPGLRQPTAEDLSFELLGDLVFDCLDSQEKQPTVSPQQMLVALAARPPDADWMPAQRARELLDKTKDQSVRDKASLLEPYGLSLLGKMLQAGELDWSGTEVVASWSRDAVAKHEAFKATLRDEKVIFQVRKFIEDRRV